MKDPVEESKRDWKARLPKLAFACNSTLHKSTEFSPSKLLFGPSFVFEGVKREQQLRNQSHEQFLNEWGESIEEAFKVACENMGKMAS